MGMKKRTRYSIIIVTMIVVAAFSLWAQDLAKLPGINAEDEHPQGCVDCHTAGDGRDSRLNVSLEELEGHPPVDNIVKTVPDDCMMCHGANASNLSTITHASHYQNPEENYFVANYDGQCLECHSLNIESGRMSVKNGPKNW